MNAYERLPGNAPNTEKPVNLALDAAARRDTKRAIRRALAPEARALVTLCDTLERIARHAKSGRVAPASTAYDIERQAAKIRAVIAEMTHAE